jgi:protein O-mannosyl-transferase
MRSNARECCITWGGSLLVALISFSIYALPLWRASQVLEEAVLDEMYLLDVLRPNRDVQGTSSLSELFLNDYWGRPLSGESSHKSWRPMTVLSFRFLNNQNKYGIFRSIHLPPIFFHRIVNVVLHTYLSHMVGSLAVSIFPSSKLWQARTTLWMATLIFALHPVHVEAVANAANRPHVLALFFSLSTLDSSLPKLIVMWTVGLLCSETMLFQLPAIVLTSAFLHWRKSKALSKVVKAILPRVILWMSLTLAYLIARYQWGSLAIPEGLLQRAETPFVHLEGWDRFRSYAYVTAIHVGKSFGIDPIGFAHEYSFNCVTPLLTWSDPRIAAPIGLTTITAHISWTVFRRCNWEDLVLWIIMLVWMATLFPICGILKVGTFIADRMCVPSSMVVSIVSAQYIATHVHRQTLARTRILSLALFASFLFGFWVPRVMQRTQDWTRHRSLFGTTRKTCPRSAKNFLQLSKLYSSNDRDLLDLTESLYVPLTFREKVVSIEAYPVSLFPQCTCA